MGGRVVVQDFRSTSSIAGVAVGNLLLGKETEKVRVKLAFLNELLVRMVGTVQAEGSASDRVVGIVVRDIVGGGQLVGANDVLERMADIQRVTEKSSNHTIDVLAIGESSSKSIERSVLLNQDNDVLNVVLP